MSRSGRICDEFGRKGVATTTPTARTTRSPRSTGNLDESLLAFTAGLIALRRDHPALRRGRYLYGARPGTIGWFTPPARR
jgi:hypothetical protein